MLSDLRKGAASAMIKAAVAVIIFVFIFWGVGTFKTDRRQVVAKVNGTVLKYSDYVRKLRESLRFYEQLSKKKLSENEVLSIENEVLSSMIESELLFQEATSMGISASAEEVREKILEYPYFKDDNDRFDFSIYRKVLSSLDMTTVKFEDETRKNIVVDKFKDLINSSVKVSEDEVKEEFALKNEKANLEYIMIDPSKFEDSFPSPTTLEVATFLEKREEDAQKYYDEHFESIYNIPEKAKIKRIYMKLDKDSPDDERDKVWTLMKKIRERIVKGEDFSLLARRYSEDIHAKDGGDMGEVTKKSLDTSIQKAVFNLQPPGITDILKTDMGLYIYMVEEITPASIKTYDSVKEDIVRKLILKDKAVEYAKSLCQTLLNLWKEGKEIGELLENNSLEVKETGEFSKKDRRIPGIGKLPELMARVFLNPKSGQIIQGTFTLNGRYYIAKIKEYHPITEEDFENKKGEIQNELLITRRFELLSRVIDSLKKKGDITIYLKIGAKNTPS